MKIRHVTFSVRLKSLHNLRGVILKVKEISRKGDFLAELFSFKTEQISTIRSILEQ